MIALPSKNGRTPKLKDLEKRVKELYDIANPQKFALDMTWEQAKEIEVDGYIEGFMRMAKYVEQEIIKARINELQQTGKYSDFIERISELTKQLEELQ